MATYKPGDILVRPAYPKLLYVVCRKGGTNLPREWEFCVIILAGDDREIAGLPSLCTADWTTSDTLNKEFEHTGVNISEALKNFSIPTGS